MLADQFEKRPEVIVMSATARDTDPDPLRTRSATTCVPAPAGVVWSVVTELAATLWVSRVVEQTPPHLLVHSVGTDRSGADDGWLTWTVETVSSHDARVTVTLDEFADRAPEPELDLLLCRLVEAALVSPAARPGGGPRRDAVRLWPAEGTAAG